MISGFEILLAFANNIQTLAGITAIAGGVGIILGIIAYAINADGSCTNKELEPISKWLKRTAITTAVAALVSCIPSIDSIWKVRIGLIKLQLASPENVQKGAEEIGRIAQKLECKYLGCEKTEDKKEKSK